MNIFLEYKKPQSGFSIYQYLHHIFKFLEFFIFLFLCIFLIINSKLNKDSSKFISSIFVNASTPLVSILSSPANTLTSATKNFKELLVAKRENITLKEENQRLKFLYVKAINKIRENKELREILNFVELKSAKYRVANLIGKSHHVYSKNIFIDIGSKSGVKIGNIVSSNQSMIGRISEVNMTSSKVLLITDASSRIPVIASKSRIRGILAGNNSNLMDILYLEKDHKISEEEMIFTSGDGDLLQPGLLVGVVKKVGDSYALVQMTENINNIDIVAVIDY